MIMPYGDITPAAQRDIDDVLGRFAAAMPNNPAHVVQALAPTSARPWLDPALSADDRYIQMWIAAESGRVVPFEEVSAAWWDLDATEAMSWMRVFTGETPNAVYGLAALAEARGVDIEDLKNDPDPKRQA